MEHGTRRETETLCVVGRCHELEGSGASGLERR